jgi:hypothetical protein
MKLAPKDNWRHCTAHPENLNNLFGDYTAVEHASIKDFLSKQFKICFWIYEHSNMGISIWWCLTKDQVETLWSLVKVMIYSLWEVLRLFQPENGIGAHSAMPLWFESFFLNEKQCLIYSFVHASKILTRWTSLIAGNRMRVSKWMILG